MSAVPDQVLASAYHGIMQLDEPLQGIPDAGPGMARSREILDAVEETGVHVGITRWHRRIAAIVPIAWYKRAVAALAAQDGTEPP